MKSVKQLFVLLAVFAAITVFVACKSSAKPAPGIKLNSEVKTVTVEHKGTGLGIDSLPQWLTEYIQRNGTRSVEALPDYKNTYVVIAEERGPELQQVITWVNNFNAQQQIGATINTRVASIFKANENKLPDQEESRRKYDNAINTLVTASYSGARKEADWWIKQRITEKGKEPEIRYTAYVIYTIDKSFLLEQVRAEIGKLKNENIELAAAFDAITAQLLEKGLEWE
ncbi:MAG: hypothetical protein LBD18_00045 [Treponema sp.]|jgi:hypothetical protein|nr:hypothetical protein [Treponema sp.]